MASKVVLIRKLDPISFVLDVEAAPRKEEIKLPT